MTSFFCRQNYVINFEFHFSDAPKTGAEIKTWLDHHLTTRIPDKNIEPALHDLVVNCQRHGRLNPENGKYECTATCKRSETVNAKTRVFCRFGFDKLAFGKTTMRYECGSYLKERTRDEYFLARSPESVSITAYNPLILLLWKANCDFTYLVNGAGATLNYTTSYAVKDKDYKETMFKEFMGKSIDWRDIFKIAVNLIQHKDMPLTECVDHLLKHNLFQFDFGYIFINTDISETRKRIVLPINVVKKMLPTSRAYVENQYDDYYPNRSNEFNQLSLFNWMINFGAEYYSKGNDGLQNLSKPAKFARGRKVTADDSNLEADDDFSDDDVIFGNNNKAEKFREGPFYKAGYNVHHRTSPFYDHRDIPSGTSFQLKNSRKRMVKLARQVIPGIYLKFTPGNQKSREDFYRRCCMLFKPWRDESKIKNPIIFPTWERQWRYWLKVQDKEAQQDIRRFLGEYERFHEEERQYYDARRKGKKTATASTSKNPNRFVLNFDRGHFDDVAKAKHATTIANFTDDQKRAYDFLLDEIAGFNAGMRTE